MRGFTLIELMIGVAIGLLASLAVTHVLVNSEGQKRSTTSGSDAQVNGALALATLQRALQPAGYGFATVPAVLGCTLTAVYSGAPVAGLPPVLAPVFITNGASDGPDTIQVLASGKHSFSVPIRIVAPGYPSPSYTEALPVASVRGIAAGDLAVAASSASAAPSTPCRMFHVTETPSATPAVKRVSSSPWNTEVIPSGTYPDGGAVLNMGEPMSITYAVSNGAMTMRSLQVDTTDPDLEPSFPAANEVFPGIVQLQALYGRDTSSTPDGKVDIWDTTTPTNNDEWRRVIAVRIAVVARSSQFEKEDVTHANLDWDVGLGATVTGSAACVTPTGANSRCLTIKIDNLGDDWKRYRYRLFETIVPLRNMIWTS